jgi:hypothetical protein
MAVCVEYAPPAMTAAQYDRIMEKLGEAGALGNPNGLAHVCYGTEGHMRVLDIWKDEASFRAFAEVLFPIVREVVGEEGTAYRSYPVHAMLLAPHP